MPHWRSQAFYLTRNRSFLVKGVAGILGFFIAVAMTAHFLFSAETRRDAISSVAVSVEMLQPSYRMLLQASEKSPERLLTWLKDTAAQSKPPQAPQLSYFNETSLQWRDLNLRQLIEHHVQEPLQQELFFNYTRCIFASENANQDKPRTFLREQAEAATAVRYAGEFHADLLVAEKKQKEALPFYLRESAHPDASRARVLAARLALTLEDHTALRQLALNPDFLRSCSPSMLLKMARLLDDHALLFRGLWTMQWQRLSQSTGLIIALLCALLWHVILITSTGLRLRKAWNYFPAILAGMLSVWLLHTLQVRLQYEAEPSLNAGVSMMHQIFFWVMYVGVPEEAVKLCLFALFLPLLLRQRSAAKAALTAGCVGLGFALNENLQYYQDYGVTIAISRLLTANIIHISLTGILGYELYLLFESRFHRAVDFLLTFGAVALTHGLYDFFYAETSIEGLEIGSMIIVALAARWYLQRLHADHTTSSQPISRTSIFCFGGSVLVGLLMVITVLDLQSLAGITLVLKEAIGLATVALIYIREFKEV